MSRNGAPFYPLDYETALTHLLSSRSRLRGRPLQNNTRLVDCTAYDRVDNLPVAAVGVLLHNTIVVAYLPSGETVLNSGGWHTVTTQDRIHTYSPAKVYNDYRYSADGSKSTYKTWVVTSSPLGQTPPKVQKCRRCKGAGRTSFQDFWVRQPDGSYGRRDKPLTVFQDCYGCGGQGLRDYGSRHICPSFEDGVVVDRNGIVVGYGRPPSTAVLVSATSPSRDQRYAEYRGTPIAPTTRDYAQEAEDYWGYPYSDAMEWTPVSKEEIERSEQEATAEMVRWANLLGGD